MNKNESRYRNSANKIHNALIALLEEKDFELITVRELCDKAGVNRSTFYLHYDNVNDLLAETMEAVYQDFFDRFGSMHQDGFRVSEKREGDLFLVGNEYLAPYLTFVKDNRKLFRLMHDKHDVLGAEKMYRKWYEEIFSPILTRFGVHETEQPYIMIFYMKGLLGLVTEWVRTDCEMPMDELINVIRKCIIKP